jgi:hypothetical protein
MMEIDVRLLVGFSSSVVVRSQFEELGVDRIFGCSLAFSFLGDLALFSFQRRRAGLDLALATK